MRRFAFIFAASITLVFWTACSDEDPGPEPVPQDDLTHIPYDPEPYIQVIPEGFPAMPHPEDNPQTIAGVQLGRMLFYDPILSVDSTLSCSSCHRQSGSFTDNRSVSVGVGGATGRRSSMSLLNVGYFQKGLFWDGKFHSIEELSLDPIENPLEMADTWENVEEKLRRHKDYPTHFRHAFGIGTKSEIDRHLAVKAISQFLRIMVSSGNSRYDRFLRGEIFPTDEELNGFEMFFDTTQDLPDAECGHCHNGFLLSTQEYINNGIQLTESLDQYPDPGRGAITGVRYDQGKFRVPSLRNIALTAPYMHDGRFETLEQVLEHYNSGGHHIPNPDEDNVNNFIHPLGLSEHQKAEVLTFLNMLTDTVVINNPDLSNPFH